MDWKSLVRDDLEPILARWNELTLELYPQETVRFIKREKDRFQNPVGHATAEALKSLLQGLAAGKSPPEMDDALDLVVRVRAVQDFEPSRALGFVFLLKRVVREAAGETVLDDLDELDRCIDGLALAAFDRYLKCREQLYRLRADEARRHTASLLMRAERSSVAPEEPDGFTTGEGSPKGGCGA